MDRDLQAKCSSDGAVSLDSVSGSGRQQMLHVPNLQAVIKIVQSHQWPVGALASCLVDARSRTEKLTRQSNFETAKSDCEDLSARIQSTSLNSKSVFSDRGKGDVKSVRWQEG